VVMWGCQCWIDEILTSMHSGASWVPLEVRRLGYHAFLTACQTQGLAYGKRSYGARCLVVSTNCCRDPCVAVLKVLYYSIRPEDDVK
jgi:hypothetical protein